MVDHSGLPLPVVYPSGAEAFVINGTPTVARSLQNLQTLKADPFLRALDIELDEAGAYREKGSDRKSVARLLAPAGTTVEQWCMDYIQHSCQPAAADEPLVVLGAQIGSTSSIEECFTAILDKTEQLHAGISILGDPVSELLLTRKCADISRAMHVMRCAGHRLPAGLADRFDELLRTCQLVDHCERNSGTQQRGVSQESHVRRREFAS